MTNTTLTTQIITSKKWTWAKPVNSILNTKYHEAEPFMSGDGRILIFDSNRPGGYSDWNLWTSTRTSIGSPWSKPVALGPNINKKGAGGASLTHDGLTLFFHSSRPGGLGMNDIWMATRASIDSGWGEPTNLGNIVNSEMYDASPSISPDGLTLYFHSRQRDGETNGIAGIWMTHRETLNSSWHKPVNLGPQVNGLTPTHSPCITSDGLSILFGSHIDEAGSPFVLWMASRKSLDAPFEKRRTLGTTMNQWATASSPTLTANGRIMVFTSNHKGSRGWDLWWTQRVLK